MGGAMITISATGLSKAYIIDPVLKNVTFSVDEKDKIGLIGANGTGKTTIFNIIEGSIRQDRGDLFLPKTTKIGYLRQYLDMDGSKSVIEECQDEFLVEASWEKEQRLLEADMSKQTGIELERTMKRYADLLETMEAKAVYSIPSRITGMLKGLGFSEEEFEKPVDVLSGGEKSRLQLAKLLLRDTNLLLLDEPTNHLDLQAIDFLENYLRDYKGSVLLISHDRYFLDRVTNRTMLLENGEIITYNMPYSKFQEQRKKDRQLLEHQYLNEQKEKKRQEEIIERFANYGRDRFIRQAQSRRKQLDKIEFIEAPTDFNKKMKLQFDPGLISGKDVLQVRNLSKAFDNQLLFQQINFDLYRKDRAGMIGPNGVGKSTLIRMIMKEQEPDSGEILMGQNVEIGYFDQEQAHLNESNTIIEEISDFDPTMKLSEIRNVLASFHFTEDDVFQEIRSLSGGEKSRIALLKLMLQKPNFLILDEPTNHLDILSKEVLEDALSNYTGTVLAISHDRYFLNKIADKILELTPNSCHVYLGNYDYYYEKTHEEVEPEEEVQETKTSRLKEKKRSNLIEKERLKKNRQLKKLEEEIHALEKEIELLHESSCQPEVYEDHQRALELAQSIEQLKEQAEEKTHQWMVLSEEIE